MKTRPTSSAIAAGLAVDETHSLHFPQLDRDITCRHDETIYQSARRHGVRLVGACGGRGVCGTCVVQVLHGAVSATHKDEPLDATPNRKRTVRACLATPLTDCEVDIPGRSLAPVVRTDVDAQALESPIEFDPLVTTQEVQVAEATLSHPVADSERLQQAMSVICRHVDYEVQRDLPVVLRAAGGKVRTCVRNTELIGVASAGSRTLGLAVDLGTTNVAGFLVDLQTLASASRIHKLPGARI